MPDSVSATIHLQISVQQCGHLSSAVLTRSRAQVLDILKKRPQSLWEKTQCGESPLHLSCCWPEGIALLRDHCANVIINENTIPGMIYTELCEDSLSSLDYALCCGNLESVSRLLQIRGTSDANDATGSIVSPRSLNLAIQTENDEIVRCVIKRFSIVENVFRDWRWRCYLPWL